MQKALGTAETSPISVWVSTARCGKSVLFSSLFILESSHGDKDHPRNNIAVGDSLPAKVELLLQKRVRESQVSILRTTSTIIAKIRTDPREEAGL